jgi:copper chaperone CopZ
MENQVIELTINDMTCGGCVASITRVVTGLDPDAKISADIGTKRVTIDSPLATDAVVAAITDAGYHPLVAN